MYKTTPHIGEIVSKAMAQKGFSKVEVAKAIGMSRDGLYKQLDKADMKVSYVLKIGQLIGVDFLELIPSLKKEVIETPEVADIPNEEYAPIKPIMVTVELDGNELTLREICNRLKVINQALSGENMLKI